MQGLNILFVKFCSHAYTEILTALLLLQHAQMVAIYFFTHLLIYSSIHSFVYLFIYSFIYLFMYS